jgi:hypothetical protein
VAFFLKKNIYFVRLRPMTAPMGDVISERMRKTRRTWVEVVIQNLQ